MKIQAVYLSSIALALCLTACSDDDTQEINVTQPPVENSPLVQTVTQTTNYGSMESETSVMGFFYDDDSKLIRLETSYMGDEYRSEFEYDGNKVAGVDYFENGIADGHTTYVYNGDILQHTLSGTDAIERTTYTYSNGHVSTIKTYYPDGPDAELLQARTLTYANGNVSEELRQDYFFGTSTYKSIYTYGSGNNPLRGLNPYLRLTMSMEGFDGLSVNNPITKQSVNMATNTVNGQYHYEIVYNTANFPTQVKRIDSLSGFVISETIIEYY